MIRTNLNLAVSKMEKGGRYRAGVVTLGLILALIPLSNPVQAAAPADLTLSGLNMHRALNATSSLYEYTATFDLCEVDGQPWPQGGTDFNGDIHIHFTLFNSASGATENWDTFSWTYQLNYGTCEWKNSPPPGSPWTSTIKYCCMTAEVIVETAGADSDSTNNAANDNNPNLAILPSQSVDVKIVVHNWGPSTLEFSNSVEGLPEGWTGALDHYTTTVPAGQFDSFKITVVSPSTIVSWPTIHVWSRNEANPGVDQETVINVIDAFSYTSDCV